MKTKAIFILFLCMMIHTSCSKAKGDVSQVKEDVLEGTEESETETTAPVERKIVDKTQEFQNNPAWEAEQGVLHQFLEYLPKNSENITLVLEYGKHNKPSLEQIAEYVSQKIAPTLKSEVAKKELKELLGYFRALKSMDYIFQMKDYTFKRDNLSESELAEQGIKNPDMRLKNFHPDEVAFLIQGQYRVLRATPQDIQEYCYDPSEAYGNPREERVFKYEDGFFLFQDAHHQDFSVISNAGYYFNFIMDPYLAYDAPVLKIGGMDSESIMFLFHSNDLRFTHKKPDVDPLKHIPDRLILAFSLKVGSYWGFSSAYECGVKLNRFAPELF